MKKPTVRFIAVGAVLLLAALAIALAQHDARQREREPAAITKPPAQVPQPIPIDESPLWSDGFKSEAPAVVRANDDRDGNAPPSLDLGAMSESMPADLSSAQQNPLRAAPLPLVEEGLVEQLGSVSDSSSVEPASGEAPPNLSPSTPPNASGLLSPPLPGSSNGPNTALPAAQLQSPPKLPNDAVIKSPPPDWLQSPPAFPPSTTPGSTPPPVTAPTMPPSSGRVTQSLSDTQRPAMPATNLQPAPPAAGTLTSTPNLPRSNNEIGAQQPPANLGSPGGSLSTSNSALPPAATLGAPRTTTSTTTSPMNERTFNDRSSTGAMSDRTLSDRSASSGPFAGTMLGRLISNQPGNRHLDGSQNPIMLIQKRMAGECQVGKKTTVVITVRNAGNSAAQDVEVIDSVPNGASFADSIPAVTPTPEGILVWKLGEMGPGDERTINLQIIPERQGELGSTAAVRFAAQASVRTLATLPKLELSFNAQPEALIGSTHAIDVTVKNVGTGVAKAVKLEADLPTHLRHDSGDAVLEAVFGDIAPGENKHIRLDTIAAEPGPTSLMLRALTEDGVQQEQQVDMRIMAPALEATITGPNRRYLDRQATFEIMIKNPGTAPATNCEFVLRLPSGLNFNTANKEGRYDATQHAVLWSVPEFPAGHAESVELTVLPVEIGAQQMTFQGFADLNVKTEARGGVTVEEQGELTFSIVQDADPIEISASTTYTVEVRNVGRPDRDVELSLQLPPGSEVLKYDAPVQANVNGDVLRFSPVPQMDGRTSIKFRVEVRHGKVGTQIVRAQLKSQNRPTLVIKEEATEVYNDRD